MFFLLCVANRANSEKKAYIVRKEKYWLIIFLLCINAQPVLVRVNEVTVQLRQIFAFYCVVSTARKAML